MHSATAKAIDDGQEATSKAVADASSSKTVVEANHMFWRYQTQVADVYDSELCQIMVAIVILGGLQHPKCEL